MAENAYNKRVSMVENQIIVWSYDRLGTVRNTNEIFCVFSKFNVLFVQAKVVSYRLQLLGIDELISCFLRFVELSRSIKHNSLPL